MYSNSLHSVVKRNTNTLADYPFKSLITCLSGNFQGFDNAVCVVGSDICFNNGHRISCPYRVDEIADVFNAYRNLILADNSLPEFNANTKGTAETQQQINLLSIIADRSNKEFSWVSEVMRTLYWGTKDGRVKDSSVLYPRKAKRNEDFVKDDGSGSINEKLDKLTTWGIPILLGIGALILVSKSAQVASAFQSITGRGNNA